MKVLNFGSLNYDYTYKVDHIMLPGETQSSFSRETFLGGKGLNQSVALAKAGVPVFHAGCVGEDGQGFLDACREYGVDTRYVKKLSGPSGHTVIQIDKNAQNCILLYPGANRKQSREQIDETLADFEEGDILLLQNEINELDYIIDQAYGKGMKVILNPSPFDSHLDTCDLHKISVFLINEVEGAQISGKNDPADILEYMRREFPEAKTVLTLGTDGAWYQDQNVRIHQPSFKVAAVDTTAAGDTFTGYFVSGLINEWPVEKIMETAALASAIAVTRNGAAPSIPAMEEVELQFGQDFALR